MASHSASKEARSRANNKYRKSHYYCLQIRFPKEDEEILKAYAKKNHMELGTFVKELVYREINSSATSEDLTHEPFFD